MSMLTPPSDDDNQVLVLQPAEPAPVVKDEEAPSMLEKLTEQDQREIKSTSLQFVSQVKSLNPNAPEFASALNDVQTLAQAEVVKATSGSSSILERSVTSVAGAKRNGSDTTVRVAKTLADLRGTVEDLTPNAADLTGVQKILGFIPGGKKIRRYFQKYESAQTQIDAIIKSLLAGQDELRKDNAALTEEKKLQWEAMHELNKYIGLAKQMDADLSAEVQRMRAAGNVQDANTIEADLLFAVRQRHQDLLTQLAVSIQGYMAMELTRKNNIELIKGVDRARTTTIQALRTAVIVANALDNQALVLDQIDSLNTTTNNMIEQTSVMLRQQTTRVHQQAVNSGVSVETLTRAFDNIYATLDEIENFKKNANETMAHTISDLTAQVERAKPQLERARALEASEKPSAQRQLGR